MQCGDEWCVSWDHSFWVLRLEVNKNPCAWKVSGLLQEAKRPLEVSSLVNDTQNAKGWMLYASFVHLNNARCHDMKDVLSNIFVWTSCPVEWPDFYSFVEQTEIWAKFCRPNTDFGTWRIGKSVFTSMPYATI